MPTRLVDLTSSFANFYRYLFATVERFNGVNSDFKVHQKAFTAKKD